MFLRHAVLGFFLASATVAFGQGDPPTLSYQGRLTVGGGDYTGPGYFKFVIHNDAEGLWSNDGTAGTNAPAGYVTLDVNHGLFATTLGAPWESMDTIHPLTFHQGTVWLRTWFTTNTVTAPFEMLTPDVMLRPDDFADFDTGNLLIVDDNGRADFQDINEAIAVAATNDRYDTVFLMPGWYALDQPLQAPTGTWTTVVGLQRDRVTIVGTNGTAVVPFNGSIENCRIEGSPAISDAGAHAPYSFTLQNCAVEDVVLQGPGGTVFVRDCWLSMSRTGAVMTLTNVTGYVQISDSRLESLGAPALEIVNSPVNVHVDNTDITGQGGGAVRLATSGTFSNETQATFRDCQLFTHSGGGNDAVVLSNLSADGSLRLDLTGCRVGTDETGRHGLAMQGGEAIISRSEVRGEDCAVHCVGGRVDVLHSDVEGTGAGLRTVDSNIEIEHSTIDGRATLDLSNSWCMALGSELTAQGTNLVVDGGVCLMLHNSMISMGGPVAVLRDDAHIASFQGCNMMSLSTNATPPVMVLAVDDGTNAPSPELAYCFLRSMGADYVIDLGGSATAATVRVVQNVFSAPLGTNLVVLGADATVAGSNAIIPVPYTLEELVPPGDED